MSITIVTPALSKRMTTVANVAEDLGIDPAANQSLLEKLIDRASSFIVSYTGRDFAKETISETFGGDGTYTILLTRTPVLSISEVWFNGTQLNDISEIKIIDKDAGIIWNGSRWTNTNKRIHYIEPYESRFYDDLWKIVYDAGFEMPDQPSPSLPYDLEQACIQLVKMFYHQQNQDPRITSQKIDTVSVTYKTSAGEIPDNVKMLLDPWRRITL